MVRGLVAFLLTVMLAAHAATPSRACTSDQAQSVSTSSFDNSTVIDGHSLELVGVDGEVGGEIAPNHHNAPCQEHCNWFASISFQGFLPLEQGTDVELSRHMLPILLAVAVPPPQTAHETDDVAS